MLAQGTESVSTGYFESLSAQISAAGTCAELQTLTTEAYASIKATIQGVESQLALLEPMMALLTAPSVDPAKIVAWITSFISSFLTPMTVPYATYTAQLTALIAKMETMALAITTKSSSFELCSITVPTITVTAATTTTA